MKVASFVIGIVAVTISVLLFVRMFLIDRVRENKQLLIEFLNYLDNNLDNFRGAKFFMFDENRENFMKLSKRQKIKLVRKIYKRIRNGEIRINLELFPEIEKKI